MPIATTFTRAQLRSRLRREIRYTGSAGATKDASLNEDLQVALSRVFEILSRTDQGVLVRTLNVTIAAGDPDGQVPGERVPLPDDFRALRSLIVNGDPAKRSNPTEIHLCRNMTGVAEQWRKYYISGPSQSDASVSSGPLLELHPDWAEGDTYSLLYVTQPPTLGDPEDTDDDALDVDLLMEPVVRAVIARAGLRSLSRDDNEGRSRLGQELAMAEAEFDDARITRGGGVRTLASYDHGRGRGRL